MIAPRRCSSIPVLKLLLCKPFAKLVGYWGGGGGGGGTGCDVGAVICISLITVQSKPISVPASSSPADRQLKSSASTLEALSIVDQMMAGAAATKDQLASLRIQVSHSDTLWLALTL